MNCLATPGLSTARIGTRSGAAEREAARIAAILSAIPRPSLNNGNHFRTGK
jgi:hypothetical protein